MFKSWIEQKNPKLKIDKKMRHAVLGTYLDEPLTIDQEVIFFACGCFWGAEKSFWKLPGVQSTAVGYAGGHKPNPTYNQVCSGKTGHTEVVKVVWNKSKIHLSDLLKLFWECHDPTQGNRQGNDSGSQYRSAIYITNTDQEALACASKEIYQRNLDGSGYGLITTEIKSDQDFFFAEEYHQQYLAKPGNRPYCSAMPTKVLLQEFPGSSYKLSQDIWSHFDWKVSHCVLRSDNNPIKQ